MDETGEAVAALAVVAPVARLPAERYREIAEAVVSAADSLSAELGWNGWLPLAPQPVR